MEDSQRRRLGVLLSHVSERPASRAVLQAEATSTSSPGLLSGKVASAGSDACLVAVNQTQKDQTEQVAPQTKHLQ